MLFLIGYSLLLIYLFCISFQRQSLTGAQSRKVLEHFHKACDIQMRGRKMPLITRRALI